MKGADIGSMKNNRPGDLTRRLPWQKLILVIVSLSLFVACSNCLCIDYFAPPMQWHNYSCNASPNVTIGMFLYPLGPAPVTILDSDSGLINFSSYGPLLYPRISTDTNDGQLDIYFSLTGSSDIRPGVRSDTYVYLPRGPNYTVLIGIWESYRNESNITNKYTGENLTLWANDQGHWPRSRNYPVTLTPLPTGKQPV